MSVDAQATDRAIKLATYLSDHRTVTLAAIARDVEGYDESANSEALRKSVGRDLKVLRERFGIDAAWNEGRQLYTVAPPFFTPGERQWVITACRLISVSFDAGMANDELFRLGAAVDDAKQHIIVTVHEHMVALRNAIVERRRVAFRYSGKDREFEPWGLGLWRNEWYVRGVDRNHPLDDPEQGRTFALSRIQDPPRPIGTPGAYEIPPTFDPDEPLDLNPDAWGEDDPVVAVVDVDRDERRRFTATFDAREVAEASDRVTYEVQVRQYRAFCDRLLHFGPRAVLRSPQLLVEMVTDRLDRLARGAQ